MKIIYFFIKCIFLIIILLLLSVSFFTLQAIFVKVYKPYDSLLSQQPKKEIALDSVVSFLSWNIGYSSLGREAIYPYEKGKIQLPDKQTVFKNLIGIRGFLQKMNGIDFMLLQEVDRQSRRSHHINQLDSLNVYLNNYYKNFAANHKASFIPYPLPSPIGKITSGLLSYSQHEIYQANYHRLPSTKSMTQTLFGACNAFLLQRFALKNGRELIVVNLQYMGGGDRIEIQQQMSYLKNVLQKEYEKGNYLVIGGDWGQCPPDFDNKTFLKQGQEMNYQVNIDGAYFPTWQWVYDSSLPTQRDLTIPYNSVTSFTTITDFFLLSPNIEVAKISTLDDGFVHSDHQPVYLTVYLKDF